MRYRIGFSGRLKGAIGVFSSYEEIVEAENAEEAILKLYEKYDSVHRPAVTALAEPPALAP